MSIVKNQARLVYEKELHEFVDTKEEALRQLELFRVKINESEEGAKFELLCSVYKVE